VLPTINEEETKSNRDTAVAREGQTERNAIGRGYPNYHSTIRNGERDPLKGGEKHAIPALKYGYPETDKIVVVGKTLST